MGILPEMTLEDLQLLEERDFPGVLSSVLTDKQGRYLATLITPQTDFLKLQAEHVGELSNDLMPKNTPEIASGGTGARKDGNRQARRLAPRERQ
jgi:hypothetical protein